MKVKDADFYNKESRKYSSKRYPEVSRSYVQFFFKRRLSILLNELGKRCGDKKSMSLLEVGCADGVVLRSIKDSYPAMFSHLVGIDTASEMVDVAKSLTPDQTISFYVRGAQPKRVYNVVVEVGVANYADFDQELIHAKESLSAGGLFVLSIAGTDSLNARLGQGVGYNNFLSYAEYEKKIESVFSIERAIPVGFYIPGIWRVPFLARCIQTIFEPLMSEVSPRLAHEMIYLLTLK